MPSVVDQPAQRYVAERATLGIEEFPRIADRLPPLIGTLAGHGIVPAGAPWGGRLEVLRTNPLEVPDPTEWVTDLLFRLAD
jgi:hypothetical protein